MKELVIDIEERNAEGVNYTAHSVLLEILALFKQDRHGVVWLIVNRKKPTNWVNRIRVALSKERKRFADLVAKGERSDEAGVIIKQFRLQFTRDTAETADPEKVALRVTYKETRKQRLLKAIYTNINDKELGINELIDSITSTN